MKLRGRIAGDKHGFLLLVEHLITRIGRNIRSTWIELIPSHRLRKSGIRLLFGRTMGRSRSACGPVGSQKSGLSSVDGSGRVRQRRASAICHQGRACLFLRPS